MTVEKIIELIDLLAPNNCSLTQKLYWYNQCESILRNKAVIRYEYVETEIVNGILKLPDGYTSEDVEVIYIDGKIADMQWFGDSFAKSNLQGTKKAEVVLRQPAKEIYLKEFEGDIFFDGDKITMSGHMFCVGDKLDIESSVFTGRVTVLGTSGDDIFVDRVFDVNDCLGKATIALDIEVSLRAPYDKLYIDYIMAQMDYYNKDFEGYNNNSYMFNEMLDELVRKNLHNMPVKANKLMKKIW